MKILVGYDGSDCANTAIEDLSRAGLPTQCEALILSVADAQAEVPFPAYFAPGEMTALGPSPAIEQQARLRAAAALDNARKIALAASERVRASFLGWKVSADQVIDSPHRALVGRAQTWHADLVVVGSHGRSALGRFILGSVSQHVLSHAPCSVRVSGRRPHAAASTGPLRIVLAVDGSDDSLAAVEAVGKRAWPAGTQVRVAAVFSPKGLAERALQTTGLSPEGDGVAACQRDAEAAAKSLRESGLDAVHLVLEGQPANALIAEADRWGADCIFLGSSGHGRLKGSTIGSVAAAVAAGAHCSVEVLRPPGEIVIQH